MANDLTFKLSINLPGEAEMMGIIDKQVLPLLDQAVRATAAATAEEWRHQVYGAKLWSGEKDAYANSISWHTTGKLKAVVEATYRHASGIEIGRGAYDLKKMLNTSKKVRRTKDGRRFLVIPMRHSVKKLKEAGLYGMAKALDPTNVLAKAMRPAGEVTHLSPTSGMHPAPDSQQTPYLSSTRTKQAMLVPSATYGWGGKLTNAQMKAAGITKEQRKWARGMVRFNTSAGQGKSSSYLTFRTMMEGSNGWIKPAEPGQHLARNTVQAIQPKAIQAFEAAIKQTLGG